MIVSPTRDRFVVQRKDSGYEPPRCVTFFGGAIEGGEDEREAIERELREELGRWTAEVIFGQGLVSFGSVGDFSVFECLAQDATIDWISRQPVYEGESAEICLRVDLRDLPWIESVRAVVEAYLVRYS